MYISTDCTHKNRGQKLCVSKQYSKYIPTSSLLTSIDKIDLISMIEKKHRQFFVILMIVYFATLSYIVEKSSEDCNVSSYWQIL